MSRAKRILLWVMAVAYGLAGFNHLVNPELARHGSFSSNSGGLPRDTYRCVTTCDT